MVGVLGEAGGQASSPAPTFPPQGNLPSPMEGPWEPWDTKLGRDSAPGSGGEGKTVGGVGPISLGDGAVCLDKASQRVGRLGS